MGKLIVLVAILLVSTLSLYTSRHFEKKGQNVKGKGPLYQAKLTDIRTVCNDVILNQAPYFYNGTKWLTQGPLRVDTSTLERPRGHQPWLSSSTARKGSLKWRSRVTRSSFGSTEDQVLAANWATSWSWAPSLSRSQKKPLTRSRGTSSPGPNNTTCCSWISQSGPGFLMLIHVFLMPTSRAWTVSWHLLRCGRGLLPRSLRNVQ